MKAVGKYDDAQLIAAINDEKELDKAIMFIYRHYSETVSSFIIHNSGNEQDADDIFQETVVSFIDVVKKGKFRMEASVKTFLVSIARNLWLNELKKRERAGVREKSYETAKEVNEMDVSHYIGDREIKQELRELLNQLGESCRKILILFYYENLSMKEMVSHLHYENEQVVRNKKYKCLQQLTGILKEKPSIARQLTEIIK
ncbi:MAG: sigma-70 family RNA polymerase sigma factor [Bacteroidetes bacterium]|nr:MAG: sigma-70 family RNA polymerase sigma factor [Bacteroidota bacterium]